MGAVSFIPAQCLHHGSDQIISQKLPEQNKREMSFPELFGFLLLLPHCSQVMLKAAMAESSSSPGDFCPVLSIVLLDRLCARTETPEEARVLLS